MIHNLSPSPCPVLSYRSSTPDGIAKQKEVPSSPSSQPRATTLLWEGQAPKPLIPPSNSISSPAPCCRSSGTGEGLGIPSQHRSHWWDEGSTLGLAGAKNTETSTSPLNPDCLNSGSCMHEKAKLEDQGLPSLPQCPCIWPKRHSRRCELLSPPPALVRRYRGSAPAIRTGKPKAMPEGTDIIWNRA